MTTTCAENRLLTPFLLRLIKFLPSNTVPTQNSFPSVESVTRFSDFVEIFSFLNLKVRKEFSTILNKNLLKILETYFKEEN